MCRRQQEPGVVCQGSAPDATQAPGADPDPASAEDLLMLRGTHLCWRPSEHQILVDLGSGFPRDPLQWGISGRREMV